MRKKSKNSEFKTDVDGKNLLFHFAKGGEVVAKVKRVGSQFVQLAGSKLSLDYEFRGSGWMKVRKNASVSADGTPFLRSKCPLSIPKTGAERGLLCPEKQQTRLSGIPSLNA